MLGDSGLDYCIAHHDHIGLGRVGGVVDVDVGITVLTIGHERVESDIGHAGLIDDHDISVGDGAVVEGK